MSTSRSTSVAEGDGRTPRERRAALIAALDRIRARRIDVPPDCRLAQHLVALEWLEGREYLPLNIDDRYAIQAVHDLTQLVPIFDEIMDELAPKQVRLLLGGDYFPEMPSGRTPTRDFEFEWFMAALAKRAGFSITLAEPDVIVEGRSFAFSIAAKRLSSIRQLRKRVRQATLQLQAAACDGIIALDIGQIVSPKEGVLIVDERAEADAEVSRVIREFLRANYLSMCNATDGRCAGFIVLATCPLVIRRRRFGTAGFMQGVCRYPPADERAAQFDRFFLPFSDQFLRC